MKWFFSRLFSVSVLFSDILKWNDFLLDCDWFFVVSLGRRTSLQPPAVTWVSSFCLPLAPPGITSLLSCINDSSNKSLAVSFLHFCFFRFLSFDSSFASFFYWGNHVQAEQSLATPQIAPVQCTDSHGPSGFSSISFCKVLQESKRIQVNIYYKLDRAIMEHMLPLCLPMVDWLQLYCCRWGPRSRPGWAPLWCLH